jgi:putative membrane protein
VSARPGWRRLHPLSPLVRGGRATIVIAVVLLPGLLTGRGLAESGVQLGIVGVLTALGFVSWLVTRWCIEGDDLRIETGLVRRQSLRFPLAQVQAIDVVRPGLARIFGLAEVRLRMGGATGATARLAYLQGREADRLRTRLLALAGGARDPDSAQEAPEHVLTFVPTGRLVASIVVSDDGLFATAVLAGLVVTAFVSRAAAIAAASGGTAWIFSVATLLWRRFNQGYRLTVAESADGLRLRSGLVAVAAETIRPGRVQAVRMVEPMIWRLLGWCRLEVDLAGRQRRKGEDQPEGRRLRAVLPVGSRELAYELLDRILLDAPRERLPPPRRAILKSPLRYRFLGWSRTETCVTTTSGRIRRVTVWVPFVKVQSLRRVQGPVQRRLKLVTLHLDTAGRNVHATLRDRDEGEAAQALGDLVRLCGAARKAEAGSRSRRVR